MIEVADSTKYSRLQIKTKSYFTKILTKHHLNVIKFDSSHVIIGCLNCL